MNDNLYAKRVSVTLTVQEWLTLHCAFWNAIAYCEDNDLPLTGRSYEQLKAIISAQTQSHIDAAAAQAEAAELAANDTVEAMLAI